jgi:endo-1,4-beta-mannosidase
VSEPFLLGVNYWPRRKAMGWWSDFDIDEVREEFDLIAGLGLDLVRVFLLWEDFQPTPEATDPARLDHLTRVADTAAERGLRLDVTFFTGHMSGPNWAPRWLLDGSPPLPDARQLVSGGRVVDSGYRNPYTDPLVLDAQERQVRDVVGRLAGHAGVWAWNLGNEPDLFAVPPDAVSGPAWARRLASAIKELDAGHVVTVGLHSEEVIADNGLRLDRVFRDLDLATMHAYPAYAGWSGGPLDAEFVPFTVALTASLSGKPVLAEEFGAPTAPPGWPTVRLEWATDGRTQRHWLLSEEDQAAYLVAVLPRLVEVGAIGALPWCFADYHRSLWDRPPCDIQVHERFFGLVRPDGSLKPHAAVLREFAASRPTVREPSPLAHIAVDPDAYYLDPMARLPGLLADFRASGRGA